MAMAIDWLMEGDPAIRWRTMRDLLDRPAEEWQPEQQRTLVEGWGALLLAQQDTNGLWGGGLYTPKWTSTTYTLLALRSIGIPRDTPPARRGARLVLDGMLGKTCDAAFLKRLAECDRCVVGMILNLVVYFGIEDERVEALIENLLAEKMPDGGWNCRRMRRPKPHHSSFNTTLNVLEGLRDVVELYPSHLNQPVEAAEKGALEFLLQHHLFLSDHTGEVIDPRFTFLAYPPRWHYDILRGLSYFARIAAPHDARLQPAIDLLNQRRRKEGLWPVQHKYAGKNYFDMEKLGGPSRWNTQRALRVLRWWENQ